MSMRTPTSHRNLSRLVRAEICDRAKQADRFTAYEVTRSLRIQNPNIEILHFDVRELVHREMRSLLRSGLYQACPVDVVGRVACLYFPAPALSLSS